jgi:hypothetical protein
MATKSIQRTMDLLTSQGLNAFIVEKFNPYAGAYGRREDFMGFIDIIAMSPAHGIVGVQACGTDWGSHVTKMEVERRQAVDTWVSCGGRVWLIGWRKLKQRKADGKLGKLEKWVPRVAIWFEGKVEELSPETCYICAACATRLGAEWPAHNCATQHHGMCGQCYLPSALCSIDDWDWGPGSKKPGPGAGRD